MLLRLLRFLATLTGGVLIGIGVTLHAEVACAQFLRDEVKGTFFLWRAIGQLTFSLQSDVRRLALSLHEVPDHVLVESERAAWTLVIVGALLALGSPLLRRPRPAAPPGPARAAIARSQGRVTCASKAR